MSRHLQVFVAENGGGVAGLMQHQQPLFKARNKPGQVLKVTAVLFVGVNHQRIKAFFLHPFNQLVFTLEQGGIGQRDRRYVAESVRRLDGFKRNIPRIHHSPPGVLTGSGKRHTKTLP